MSECNTVGTLSLRRDRHGLGSSSSQDSGVDVLTPGLDFWHSWARTSTSSSKAVLTGQRMLIRLVLATVDDAARVSVFSNWVGRAFSS